MKNFYEEFKYEASSKGIDEVSAKVRSFVESINQTHKEAVRYALSIEEVLNKSFETAVPLSNEITLRVGKRFFRHFIELDIEGESNNVYIENHRDHSVLIDSFLKSLNVTPEYSYVDNSNVYSYRIKKKKINPFFILMFAMIAAVVVGMLGMIAIPDATRSICVNSVLGPLHDTFLNILGCVAGPMIFLSVAWGIYGIGDAATFKQVGSKLLFDYLRVLVFVTTIATIFCIPFFRPNFSMSAGRGSAASEIFNMILGLFPSNIFSPFVDGNTLQIIFLGVIVGIALMFLGRRTKEVAVIVEQINIIVEFLIEIISVLVPYFIFVVLLELMWSDSIGVIAKVSSLCLGFAICVLIFTVFMWLYTAAVNHIGPIELLKKGLPTLTTGITTASSAACFGINMKECQNELGIDNKIASFGLPIGMVAFKGSTSINYAVMAVFFAKMYDVDVSISWILILIVTAAVLSVATPPIPGGAASAYAVLMVQMGIPTEALAIALACDVLFDFIATGTDQFIIPYMLLNQANKMGLVNKKILLNENK